MRRLGQKCGDEQSRKGFGKLILKQEAPRAGMAVTGAEGPLGAGILTPAVGARGVWEPQAGEWGPSCDRFTAFQMTSSFSDPPSQETPSPPNECPTKWAAGIER